jgi:hypothetical protein
VSGQISQLVEKVRALPDAEARDTAIQLAQAILDLHREALARLLALIPSEADTQLMERLAADPKIGGVLLLHDLHPVSLAARVRKALDSPALRNAAEKIELLSTEEGVIRVRMEHGGDVRAAVEQIIWEAAPDAREVIVEGSDQAARSGFVPIQQLLAGSP